MNYHYEPYLDEIIKLRVKSTFFKFDRKNCTKIWFLYCSTKKDLGGKASNLNGLRSALVKAKYNGHTIIVEKSTLQ